MGVETMMVMGGLSMLNTAVNTNSQAKAAKSQAEKTMENMVTDIRARGASQQASFIGSGIATDADTGVFNVLNSTFATGIEDIELFSSNTEKKIDKIYSDGFSNMLMQGVSMGSMAGGGGAGGLGSLFGGGASSGTASPATSAVTAPNTGTGGTSGFASLTNLFNFGG